MSARAIPRHERLLVAIGWLAALAALLLTLLGPRDALTGWLGAASFLAALPIGALVFLLVMRLISGKWTDDLRGPARLLGALWPPAALAFVPVLIGIEAIYPGAGSSAAPSAFAAVWLNPVFFIGRTIAWFALGWYLAVRIAGSIGEGWAAAALIAVVLAADLAFSDWLMALTPHFASTGFGLQALAFATGGALALMILLRLAAGAPHHPAVLGKLLLTMLLFWLYFQYLTCLVVWSGNLPDSVAWYAERSSPLWIVALAVVSLLGLVPLAALFLPKVRASPRWLCWCAGSVLAGSAIEFAWLALPGRGGLAVVTWLVALAGLGCLAVAAILRAARLAEARL